MMAGEEEGVREKERERALKAADFPNIRQIMFDSWVVPYINLKTDGA